MKKSLNDYHKMYQNRFGLIIVHKNCDFFWYKDKEDLDYELISKKDVIKLVVCPTCGEILTEENLEIDSLKIIETKNGIKKISGNNRKEKEIIKIQENKSKLEMIE